MAENNKWTIHYSERRSELSVFDLQGNMIFAINGEEIWDNDLDRMDDHDRIEWLRENYSAEIEDILESRA